ncbi:MAG: 2-hydroxychromene-2-carboxylate isomerase [Rhodobacteraceae bacterium]|nr:2-hydroxychromene-2-carboxylate isomerase [Paracoccaceae bacterium]
MARIEYFVNLVSMFTYLAGNRLEELAARQSVEIIYKPFDLMAVFARTGGLPLGERHPSRQAYRLQEIARISRHFGLPVNPAPRYFPTNPAPASYAIIAAQNAGGGDVGALVQTLLRACFAEDLNVAEDVVIKQALSANGFDPALADLGLMEGAETYVANTEEAINRGVFGAPFYIVGDERFWGQDRLDYLEEHLKKGQVK